MKEDANSERNGEVEKFDNGLVKDVNYYMASNSRMLTVGHYQTKRSLTTEIFFVTANQYATLRCSRWIDGLVIDAFVAANIDDWEDFTFICTDDTKVSIGKENDGTRQKLKGRAILKTKKPIGGHILMPYLFEGHWRLLVANVKQQNLMLLDPYRTGTDKDRVVAAFHDLLHACEEGTPLHDLRNLKWEDRNISERAYQPENDGTNCGAFIMYYMECLGSEKEIEKDFDPVAYRNKIAYDLLSKSEDVGNVCLHCFSPIKTVEAKCKMCDRRSHKACVFKTDYKSADEDEALKKSRKRKADVPEYFVCRLCKRYCNIELG